MDNIALCYEAIKRLHHGPCLVLREQLWQCRFVPTQALFSDAIFIPPRHIHLCHHIMFQCGVMNSIELVGACRHNENAILPDQRDIAVTADIAIVRFLAGEDTNIVTILHARQIGSGADPILPAGASGEATF